MDDNNYEYYVMAYYDGELDDVQSAEVEQYLAEHPELRDEMDVLASLKVTPPSVSFPDKGKLRRRTKAVWWPRMAAAAVVLMAVLGTVRLLVPHRPVHVAVVHETPRLARMDRHEMTLDATDSRHVAVPIVADYADRPIAAAKAVQTAVEVVEPSVPIDIPMKIDVPPTQFVSTRVVDRHALLVYDEATIDLSTAVVVSHSLVAMAESEEPAKPTVPPIQENNPTLADLMLAMQDRW